jgi:membrane protein YqaA with SNARE-associated domain
MGSLVGRLEMLGLALGAPGLFLVALLDSSLLSLPEVPDLLVVLMVTRHKSALPIYVISATLGSIAGCLVMYYIGRIGGEALLRKRFAGTAVDRAVLAFQRHGVMAVFIPSILPPPAPFKIFVLLAGVVGISPGKFTMAVAAGRVVRYLALGLLALRYGDQALAFAHRHERALEIAVLALIALGLAAYIAWTRSGRGRHRGNRVS